MLAKGRLHTKLINIKQSNSHPKPGVGIQNLGVDASRPSQGRGLFDRRQQGEGVLAGVEEGGGRDAVVVCREVGRVDQDWARWGRHVVSRVAGVLCLGASLPLVARILGIAAWSLYQGAGHRWGCPHCYRQGGSLANILLTMTMTMTTCRNGYP